MLFTRARLIRALCRRKSVALSSILICVKKRDETMMRVVLLTLLLLLPCGQAIGQGAQPTKIRVRGVELHYIEQGQGEPLILLHGGQGDYRSWEPQMKVLSQQYRVISYSRRYNYPNNNPLTAKYHSAYTEADDLAAFIDRKSVV